jgi:hypothetical protein
MVLQQEELQQERSARDADAAKAKRTITKLKKKMKESNEKHKTKNAKLQGQLNVLLQLAQNTMGDGPEDEFADGPEI